MKTKLLLPFLTALVLTGCSNDDAPDNNGGGSANGETNYLAVNIVTPKDVVGRDITSGTSDGGFEYGTDDENAATSATFILLDGDNKVFQISTETLTVESTNSPTTSTPHGNVEKVFNAVIVVNGSKEKPNITGIIAILNAPTFSNIKVGSTLAQIKEELGGYGTNGTSGTFIMSNSVYIKNSNNIIATTVSKDDLYPDKELAKTHPVQIYVERVVAKIKTNAVSDITSIGNDKFNHGAKVTLEEGTGEIELKIDIKGIQIANCAQQSYLLKNIDGFGATGSTAPWENWNDDQNNRSYWAAKTPASSATTYNNTDFANNSWNEISGTNSNTAKQLTSDQIFYVQENINQTYKTSVIVTAQLQKSNDSQAVDFVRIGGLYYTKDDGLTHIAALLDSRGYRVKNNTDNQTAHFTKDCIEWIQTPETVSGAKAWNASAQIKETYKTGYTFFIDGTPTQDLEVNTINTTLNEPQYRALWWKNGMCYYFAEIEHFGTITTGEGETATTVKRNGIIRNHLYNITLNSIGGLGVPVIDPDEDIIPERPGDDESLFYLAAKVNILSWKVVSQGVDLK